jgi:hypothetical protein
MRFETEQFKRAVLTCRIASMPSKLGWNGLKSMEKYGSDITGLETDAALFGQLGGKRDAGVADRRSRDADRGHQAEVDPMRLLEMQTEVLYPQLPMRRSSAAAKIILPFANGSNRAQPLNLYGVFRLGAG